MAEVAQNTATSESASESLPDVSTKKSGALSRWASVQTVLSGRIKTTPEVASKWRSLVENATDGKQVPLFEEHTKLMKAHGAEFASSCAPLSSSDVLIVVDMQNDFLPVADAPDGGNFGVADGAAASSMCVKLIAAAAEVGARIVASRDYHPKDHCSFFPQSGPFPPHCVQGHVGSHFFPPIAKALTEARKKTQVDVVFKGFCNSTDSFGGFAYSEQGFVDRNLSKLHHASQLHGCSGLDWTGSFLLNCSNIENDINAPPDVMAVFDRKPAVSLVKGASRIVVCGLAFDFCVLDTCVNFVESKTNPEASVVCAYDAARAAHIPGFGQHGSGFLSDPKFVLGKIKAANISLASTAQLVPTA